MSESTSLPRWCKAQEAMAILDVSHSTLRRWSDAGHIRAGRTPGNQRRYNLDDVERIAHDGVTPEQPAQASA